MAEDWERLAQLFHGLRTPLNGMIGYSKLILEEVVDDPQEEWEFLQEAYQLALHLLSISNGLSDLERTALNENPGEMSWRERLSRISYEFRTPLNEINDRLKSILNGRVNEPDERKEFLQRIYNRGLHLLAVTNDVLDIAKIETSKLQLDLRPLHLDELLSAITSFFHSHTHREDLSFQIQQPTSEGEIIVFADNQYLRQVLFNLVANAINFTDQGDVIIQVEVIERNIIFRNQNFPGLLQIQVIDTDIGVSPDQQARLFQSLSQINCKSGRGLGLAISARLVEAMGGSIHFYSAGEGLGSTATFTVPLYELPSSA